MPKTPYTLKAVERSACTMLLPTSLIERVRAISKRTGVPANTISALALDEYLARRYPEAHEPDAVQNSSHAD